MNLPTQQQALEYFEKYKVPDPIKNHCLQVQRIAVFLAQNLKNAGVDINLELVQIGSLLHDLFKAVAIKEPSLRFPPFTKEQLTMREQMRKKYPHMFENQIAFDVFKDDYPELAKTLLNEGDPYLRERNWEESVIHYADYRVFREELVSLETRFEYFKQRYPAEEGFWSEYFDYCQQEEAKIFNSFPFNPGDLKRELEKHHG